MASIQEIWNRYRLGKANLDEKKKLIEAIDKEDTKLGDILSENWKTPEVGTIGRKEKNVAWEKLAHSVQIKKRRVVRLYQYGIAAGIAALVALTTLFHFSSKRMIEVGVASGEKVKEVWLPDGSKVWINHASSIAYPKEFDSESRNLVLKGHAFFEIEKNPSKPFIVTTDGFSIKVLGTSFDVYNFKNEASTVSVKSGRVEVSHIASHSKILLAKNEQSRYDARLNGLVKTPFDPKTLMAWRNNTLQFENLELGKAIKQIERKYGVRIVCTNTELLKTRIRASYKGESLDTVLTDLAFMTNFDFKKNETSNEITIKPMDMGEN